ncbi:basic amino acid ABC transporter substrate-binding protein [Sutterella megalosphaeroides]|uniref:Basic amino acid ABC transporter substrate-binding protein n=1 Tax=Sutterella megalosphaeroides TaxID=2494234 RepID=A0A2Z6IBN9_9BURK|nr:basic amino acid ABC transporter substrate-binding protein [Sutterella megalosphaeroides]BBF23981.1 basic amino acid ABC transporter substrate-binding protein [Sutterella megalosphaeroides]
MSMKKFVLGACAAALMSTALSGAALARDLLRVGTEPTFAPFEFLDTETKQFAGFDMDLIRAVADKAGYDVEILNMGFDALIPALMTRSIDVIAAGLSITEERAKRVDFTKPYYTAGLSMLVRKGDAQKYPDFKALENQRIAVQIGTTGADTAKDIKGAKVAAFNTTSEAFMDLATGNSAAVVHDRPVLAYFLKTQAKSAGTMQLQPEILDAQSYGFAVRKGNKELLEKLNKAYDELVASGEVQKIHDKWFAQ